MKATYIDHMGTDLSVVNAARVSFGKKSEWVPIHMKPGGDEGNPSEGWIEYKLSTRDKGLIRFLARGCTTGDWENLKKEFTHWYGTEGMDDLLNHVKNMPTHWTPFGHTAITLHIKAPIFVARQLGKHQVGMVWNEVSRRYVTDDPVAHMPKIWRKSAENVKQGSSDEPVTGTDVESVVRELYDHTNNVYHELLDAGVCPEQARMVLPQSMYTEWYWTGNLYSFANVFIQRTDSHAQREVQNVARQIGEIIEPLFPVSWSALTT